MKNPIIILGIIALIAGSCGGKVTKNGVGTAGNNAHIRTEFLDYGDIRICDSIFYDSFGNDTLIKSFTYTNETWQLTQIFRQQFNAEGQVVYFITESNTAKKPYKKEIFYIYNQQGKLTEETEYECSATTPCDSIFKTKYAYDTNGELQSKTFYMWQSNEWLEWKQTK